MTKAEAEKIEMREATFLAENPNKQWTQVVLITTKGAKQNSHSGVAKKGLTLDDLFEK